MFIIVQAAIFIVLSVYFQMYSSSPNPDYKVVRMSKAFGVVSYSLMYGTLLLEVFLYFISDIFVSLMVLPLSLLSVLLFLKYYGFEIRYSETDFQYRKFFGNYITITYKDIVDVELGMDLILRTKDDTITFSRHSLGVAEFYVCLLSKVKKPKKQKKVIPRVRKIKDAVYRPTEFIAASIVGFFVLPIVAFALMLYCVFVAKNVTPGDEVPLLVLSGSSLILLPLWFFLTYMSITRAHSSKFWKRLLPYFLKDGYYREP